MDLNNATNFEVVEKQESLGFRVTPGKGGKLHLFISV